MLKKIFLALVIFSLAIINICFTVLSNINVDESRLISQEKLDAFRKDKAFNYDVDPEPQNNWLDDLLRFLNDLLFSESTSVFWKYFPYLILAIGVVIFIKNILKAKLGGVIQAKSKAGYGIEHFVEHENINTIDFDAEIELAIEHKFYRKAVRLHYLKNLKALSEKQLIDWKLHKTNLDYKRELMSSPLAKPFASITNAFEKYWYGKTEVDAINYEAIRTDFLNFNQAINTL